jgi:multidrug efflux system outer membrane protein
MRQSIIVLLFVCLLQPVVFGQQTQQPVNPQPTPQAPVIPTPQHFRGDVRPQPDGQSMADLKWFELFRDPKLQQLIQDALTYNYDVREAVARVEAARATLGITRSEQFPQIYGTGDVVNQRSSRSSSVSIPEPIQRDTSFGSILLNLLNFEIDIWGRLRKQTAAARADLLSTEETRRFVLTTVISDVATAYFSLREFDYELEISRSTLASRQESLRLINLRQQRGVATMLEVRQAEELVYDATEVIPSLEQSIEQTENFISFLTGRTPSAIERGLSLTDPVMPLEVPPGLPSDLIERRPDIRTAEANLTAANLRIDVAKKEWFPRISLTSFLGYQSGELSSLFNASRNVWNVAGNVSQPIFTGGRIKNNIRFTKAQRDFFLVDYQRTVEAAFRDVSDSLVGYRKQREVRTQRELLVKTLQDRSRLSYLRYTGGVATLLDALDADRELFDAERSLAQARRDELLAVVQLYKALGGGWQ